MGVAKDVVFFEDAASAVEYANAAVATVVNLVLLQRRIRIGFDPNARHRVVENLVLLQNAETTVVDEDAAVLTSPYLVSSDGRESGKIKLLSRRVISNLDCRSLIGRENPTLSKDCFPS